MSLVSIKQVPDDYAETTGLAKYDRSRMPKCKDQFSVYFDDRTKRYLTGLDEDFFGVKKEEKEKIKELRLNLEEKTGQRLDALSPFWADFKVVLESDRLPSFDTEKPMDVVALKALIINGYIAPTKEDAFTPNYKDAQYYAYTEEGELEEETTDRKKRDQAISKLLDISENKEKMLLYGQYLEGIKYSPKFKEDTLYKMLRAFIESKDAKNASDFLAIVKKPVEEVQQKIVIDKALKQGLIAKSHIGNKKYAYQFGQSTLGTTVDEVYKNLSLPEFAPELRSIKQELDKRN